ncbi:MAG: hypothetical protein D6708_03845, partial [Candidatus Dadabacteria bacterium]
MRGRTKRADRKPGHRWLGLALALALLPGWAGAATFNLVAAKGTVTLPDASQPGGTVDVPVWGYALDPGAGNPVTVTLPGPVLEVPAGDTSLTINLRNELPEAVSIAIPGLPGGLAPEFVTDSQGRRRVKSFAATAAPGQTVTYTWTNLRPGTFLYASGTRPDYQIPMGLYGALVVHDASGAPYSGVSVLKEALVVYSSIDPALNQAVDGGTFGTAAYPTVERLQPRFFLVNGKPYSAADPTAPVLTPERPIRDGEPTLLRFVNAGATTVVPTLVGGELRVLAEDAFPYPYPYTQYNVFLPPQKTADAVFTPQGAGSYPLFDARLGLTNNLDRNGGAQVYLEVVPNNPPAAAADTYTTDEDAPLTVAAAQGVLANDADPDGDPITAVLVDAPANGTVTLNADGSFTYTPNADFNGTDTFTYQADDGLLQSAVTTVTITVNAVNDAPVLAAIGDKAVDENVTLTFSVSATDVDTGDTASTESVTLTATGLPTGATFVQDAGGPPFTGTFTW